jgi:hypothetical protein
MRMAKATGEDLDSMMKLIQFLDQVSRGYLPDGDEDEKRFDDDNEEHLREFHKTVMQSFEGRPGGPFRVVFGFMTVLDPINEIFDPDLSYLELHPRLVAAQEMQEASEEEEFI